jgi:hypothetical protein
LSGTSYVAGVELFAEAIETCVRVAGGVAALAKGENPIVAASRERATICDLNFI